MNGAPRSGLRTVRVLLALLMVVLGVALLAVTVNDGGGEVGYLLGALFTLLGAGRLYLLRAR